MPWRGRQAKGAKMSAKRRTGFLRAPKNKRAPAMTPEPVAIFRSSDLGGADGLHGVQPGLHAALEGREGVLGGGSRQFTDLAQFADIGLERRLGEIGLEFK